MTTTTVRAEKTVLKFAILTYREESKRWGVSWTARCVLTGGIAEGTTEERAIENLRRGIDAAIWMAAKFGMSPREWYETQEPDEPKYLAAFCRLVPKGIRTEVMRLANGDCEIEASVATGYAA
ncbi:MAG: hypothetical protein ACHQ1G_07875 [Planctomycetota bacterium]